MKDKALLLYYKLLHQLDLVVVDSKKQVDITTSYMKVIIQK